MLKSLFLSIWLSALSALLSYGLYLMIFGSQWKALGYVLLGLGPLSLIASFYTRQKGRSSRHPSLPTIMVSLGVILTLQKPFHLADILSALVAGSGWILYLFWYTQLKRPPSLIELNKILPDFTLPNTQGKKIKSSDFKGHKTLWLFFRGNWCPLCMAQIKEIAQEYKTLVEMNTKVVLISPQSEDHSQKLAQKYEVPFEFLFDADFSVIHSLNLKHAFGLPVGLQALGYKSDTVFPTLVITDTQGKVRFLDQTDDYRLRPEPQTFLKLLKELD